MSSWNRVVSRRLVYCVIAVRCLYRGGKLRNKLLLEFSWVTSKSGRSGPAMFLLQQRWSECARLQVSTALMFMIKVLWVMSRSAALYFPIFRRKLPPSYSSSRVHLSLKANPVLFFFETSAVTPAVEHRGTQRTKYHGKWELQRSQLLYCICIIHSFIHSFCSLLRQAHNFLQSQFSTECHLVFAL